MSAIVISHNGKRHRRGRINRLTQERHALLPRPSRATTIAQGYRNISRFFPGYRAELAVIDDELVLQTLGPVQPGKPQLFEGLYISTGGQLYELMMEHDRLMVDMRLRGWTESAGLCCHPYDLCTELILREAGGIVMGEHRPPLSAPLDVTIGLSWIGFPNATIYEQVPFPFSIQFCNTTAS